MQASRGRRARAPARGRGPGSRGRRRSRRSRRAAGRGRRAPWSSRSRRAGRRARGAGTRRGRTTALPRGASRVSTSQPPCSGCQSKARLFTSSHAVLVVAGLERPQRRAPTRSSTRQRAPHLEQVAPGEEPDALAMTSWSRTGLGHPQVHVAAALVAHDAERGFHERGADVGGARRGGAGRRRTRAPRFRALGQLRVADRVVVVRLPGHQAGKALPAAVHEVEPLVLAERAVVVGRGRPRRAARGPRRCRPVAIWRLISSRATGEGYWPLRGVPLTSALWPVRAAPGAGPARRSPGWPRSTRARRASSARCATTVRSSCSSRRSCRRRAPTSGSTR